MSKFIAATYHKNIEVAEFVCDDGRRCLRLGGRLPWRIFNPGDIKARMIDGKPAPKKAKGFIGFAENRSGNTFLIFPDEATGRTELKANLNRMHGDKNIPELIPVYAPPNENDTDKYVNDLLALSGIAANKKIKDCSDAELEKIIDSIAAIEGYNSKPETRREIWVTVFNISATNGSQPMADEEIILNINEKKQVLKSDPEGRFPPVILSPGNSQAKIEARNEKTNNSIQIGIISGNKSQDYSLLAKHQKWRGVAGSEKPALDSKPKESTQVRYVVQPGDSLGKIASLYRTTVEAIKNANNLKSDMIFPAEVLLIGGGEMPPVKRLPARPPATTAKSPAPAPSPSPGVPQGASTERPVSVEAPNDARDDEPIEKRPGSDAHVVFPETPSATRSTDSVRSKEGGGKLLALLNPYPKRAPWMPIALEELRTYASVPESELEKVRNYHTKIGDGIKGMVGTNNAWCAAFANWVLKEAGYPIENIGFLDRRVAIARAHGFYELHGPKSDSKDKVASLVRNPLYAEIDSPIFGAISIVFKGSHGHHVGFAYARSGERLILLGGNQAGAYITFSPFNMKATPSRKKKNSAGAEVFVKGNPSHLRYFVPTSYYEQAKKELSDPKLEEMSSDILNKTFGVRFDEKNEADTR
ncbi:LysM peptidoglycan-binding domain-containing protein [Variovorax rhizosphaerae]|uniref:LysM peptidoglycan-binding domain-containing protein n=1 Tax=Variovorax rhizosphaerae TaxID=1836200 RepID=A0ABU8WYA9_9BURK